MARTSNKERIKRENLTYEEFIAKVKEFVEKHNKSGIAFVATYERWLDIYYTNHGDRAFDDLVEDALFKKEVGISEPRKPRAKKPKSE